MSGNPCFAPFCEADAVFEVGNIQSGAMKLACRGHAWVALTKVDPEDRGGLSSEVDRLRRGLAIIRGYYPEARDVATAILWPMEKGGEA